MYELILVSQSPRRSELLAKTPYSFRTDTVKVSEIIDENLNIDDAIMNVAKTKAGAFAKKHNHLESQRILVLCADTLVVYQDQVLGKPEDKNQAFTFLRQLSGKTHSVKTGLCVYNFYDKSFACDLATTEISFRVLTDEEIEDYVNSGEPMDKAGAYGIQGEAQKFVVSQNGDFDNVVGLPLFLFEKMVKENGWKIFTK